MCVSDVFCFMDAAQNAYNSAKKREKDKDERAVSGETFIVKNNL